MPPLNFLTSWGIAIYEIISSLHVCMLNIKLKYNFVIFVETARKFIISTDPNVVSQ